MQCASSGIDSRDARWRQDHVLFLHVGTHIFQEGRFTRTGLARQKYRLASILDEVQRILKFGVMGIYLHIFFRVLRIALADRACFQAQI